MGGRTSPGRVDGIAGGVPDHVRAAARVRHWRHDDGANLQVDLIAWRADANRVDRLNDIKVVSYSRVSCRIVEACLADCLTYWDDTFAAGRGPAEDLIFCNVGAAVIGRFPGQMRTF